MFDDSMIKLVIMQQVQKLANATILRDDLDRVGIEQPSIMSNETRYNKLITCNVMVTVT